ncbi:hypothetical protein SLS62_009761 [Diatrype stigma]|uniref:DUF6924 domain-containing protein n=1 Tax=Diatrype stigma TaxID=117547 RepID=A0AAN9UC93_9PEZI
MAASTKALEATLPRKAPNTEQHRAVLNAASGQYKYQIYALAPSLNDASTLAQLEREINDAAHDGEGDGDNDDNDDNNKEPSSSSNKGSSALAAAAAQFADGKSTLRDVYEHHVRARDADPSVHPLYFVVADRADWRAEGLLAVHLDCGYGEEEDRVGVGRCGVDWADSWGVNLDIGNMDWMDLKEMEEQEWGGEDPYADEDDEDGGEDGDEDGDGGGGQSKDVSP